MIDLSVEVDGYSGPFDLLCSLVESGKFRVSGIKISQLIKIYGLYLVKSRQTPADTLADFFRMTAGLVLEKTRSLLPNYDDDSDSEIIPDEEEFMKSLERYKPYRKIYLWLAEKFALSSLSYPRGLPDVMPEKSRDIVIDGSGAYILAKTWKAINARYTQNAAKRKILTEAESNADWDGFAQDDQKQIEARVAEIESLLGMSKSLSLHEIAGNNLVVTLLAVLELCRMGRAKIEQDELFSDVRIITKD